LRLAPHLARRAAAHIDKQKARRFKPAGFDYYFAYIKDEALPI
jgi:hypothetical protein